MSTTDTRAAFEAWAIKENYAFYSESERSVLFYGVSGTRNAIQKAWEAGMAQAATEASKATGTAGEQTKQSIENIEELIKLPPCDVIAYSCVGENDAYSPRATIAYGRACAEAARKEVIQLKELLDLKENRITDFVAAARQPAPVVLSDDQIEELARKHNLDGSMLNGSRMDDYVLPFARAVIAAINRSQPEKQRQVHCPNCGAHGEHICPARSQP